MSNAWEQFSSRGFSFSTFFPRNGRPKKNPIFFAHSTGFSVAVYARFLQIVADQTGHAIGAYDLRGFGQTSLPAVLEQDTHLWLKMVDDHAEAYQAWFNAVSRHTSLEDAPILMGHSLGGWISVMASARLKTRRVIALDPVLLPQPQALIWGLSVLFGLRSYHPIARNVLRRDFRGIPFERLARNLKTKKFFKGWHSDDVEAFLKASYAWDSEGKGVPLRDQRYEALVFQMQPPSGLNQFLCLPVETRRSLPYHFLVGGRSDVCNPRAGWVLRRIFKEASVQILDQKGHMFPLQSADETIALIEQILQKDRA